MNVTEPFNTAFILTVLGALMALSVLSSRAAGKAGIPVAVMFIGFGVLAGEEGIGGIAFDDFAFAFRIGTVALVLILFDGGLNTPLSAVRLARYPAGVLATLGVLLTGALVAVAGHFFGLDWPTAALLGAIVSSTDAAATFSVLRGSGLHLKKRVGATLEVESGLNDPMAVILTIGMTRVLVEGQLSWWTLLLDVAVEMAVGGLVGVGVGLAGRQILKRAGLSAGGLYPVLTLALAFLAFGLPTLFHGSGFLAVYVAALLIGNADIRYRSGVLRVHDAVAWFGQVTMFLVMGLLVTPSKLLAAAPLGLGLGLVLALVARPVAIVLCLLPFPYSWKERGFIGWVGLRGAVPIILATFPVLAAAPGARDVFHIVFFVVVVNAFVPGATVPWLTRKLSLQSDSPPPPAAALEMVSTQLLSGEMVSFYIAPASAACGAAIVDLPFPDSATASILIRGAQLIGPRGNTVLQAGDHLYVFCTSEDLPLVRLIFGQQEAS